MKLNGFSIGTIIVTLLIITGLTIYVAVPLWSSIDATKKTVIGHDKTLAKSRQAYNSLRRLSQNSNKLTEQAQIAKRLVPEEPRLGDFLIQMEAFLSNQGITKASFELPGLTASGKTSNGQGNPTALTGANAYSFTIDGQASLDSIKQLISATKTVSRLSEIIALDIIGGDQAGSLTFQIKGNVFSRAPITQDQPDQLSDNITTEASNRFADLKEYGQLIDIERETGFGRPNPFLPY